MKKIKIKDDFIKLGQALKLAGLVDSGAYAKEEILSGFVKVNGDVCFMRGKKLYKGDKFEYENSVFEIE